MKRLSLILLSHAWFMRLQTCSMTGDTHLLLPMNTRLGACFLPKPLDWAPEWNDGAETSHYGMLKPVLWRPRMPLQREHNQKRIAAAFCFKHLKKMHQKAYNISRNELDAYRFLHVQLHLVTRASLEPIKMWNPVRQISRNAPKCRYQATWSQEIGFACTKHHKTTAAYVPIKFCKWASFREFETWSTNSCLNILIVK